QPIPRLTTKRHRRTSEGPRLHRHHALRGQTQSLGQAVQSLAAESHDISRRSPHNRATSPYLVPFPLVRGF
ncbi:MAG TPA: hypothetical protein VJ935_03135, partial [Acidimicrobiia bacterium]|nr:hypothetical protein [Acidimicrobiia bacterium]